MLTLDAVRALCTRLGYLDAEGRLKVLDSLQQMELLIEAEQVLGVRVVVESVAPEVFVSVEALQSFLNEPPAKR